MRFLLMTIISALFVTTNIWETDFIRAKQAAQAEHKYILLNFSGSDWCGPCIQMHKEIFETDVFDQYAKENLVLAKADFPRLKKNQLSKEQQSKNDQLAELYNKEGKFPFTLLLTSEGRVLKTWEGHPHLSPDAFLNDVKAAMNANQ
jgi:thioredoxin-related protein